MRHEALYNLSEREKNITELFALHISINEKNIAPTFASERLPLKSQFLHLCGAPHKRKGWMFANSIEGTHATAAIFSFVEACKHRNLSVILQKGHKIYG